MLQYISFARGFKPIINKEAAELLVNHYGHLRLRDSTTTGKSTWRITVRQLESMIRLAEAMARMEIADEVKPKHVKEAYRLLNKSIIRVEQPDIHLDDEENNDQNMSGGDDIDDMNIMEGGPEEGSSEAPAKKKLLLRYEEYKALSDMIVIYMRREEARLEEGKIVNNSSEILRFNYTITFLL